MHTTKSPNNSGQTPYRIEYQPQLIEDAVLCAIAGHPEENTFRKERDELYECADDDTREIAFQDMHQRWFSHLELGSPVGQIFELWPILVASTHRCLLLKARSKKGIGAELYVAPEESVQSESEQRTIIIQLTPELLCQSRRLLDFLRYELLHIVDMLDPNFGYEPDFPETPAGPSYDHFLQRRYTVLWDAIIDGRLYQKSWLPPSVREKHWTIFKGVFPEPEKELARMFTYFFDQGPHTHHELMSFAQNPEKWIGTTPEASTKGPCALCHFPAFHLINPVQLPADLLAKIHQEYPAWSATEPICQQCVDLFDSRLS